MPPWLKPRPEFRGARGQSGASDEEGCARCSAMTARARASVCTAPSGLVRYIAQRHAWSTRYCGSRATDSLRL
jgi:hypothetical protein